MKCVRLGLILFLIFQKAVESYKILTLLYLCNGSMRNLFDPILLELAKKGNNVTVIASSPGTVKHENIQELEGLDIKTMIKSLPNPDFIDMRLKHTPINVWYLRDKWTSDCDKFYNVPAVKNILNSNDKYDLIFLNSYMNECTYGIAHHLNASTIMISVFPVQPWAASVTATPSPLSFVSHIYHVSSGSMRFGDRIMNIYQYARNSFLKYFYYVPAIERVYQKYVPNAPGVSEIESNVSLVMGAGHFSFSPLRPIMTGIVDELAGIHCRDPKPLPNEISRLIRKKGVDEDFIYFSFGSIVQGHKLPPKYKQAFISAFSKLNISVLWKYEVDYEDVGTLPSNIHMLKWFPQQDVLGHPKCKLFITHGGISSVTEALYHGVPIIGIPFFTDQDWNLKQAERIGVGVKLELEDVTEQVLDNLFHQFINEETYQKNADARSLLFRDRPLDVLSNAVWWVEHVLKHGGAEHLKSPARKLNFIQYYSIDIAVFLVLSGGFLLLFCYMLLRFGIQAVCTIVTKKSKG
ncbi:unnamed protein product [Orchesella dallaii]|uniref:UDP-glucuronosyltransferase n=1 Tax=Orchesella dallaii TaxID=48710 RepID=A0ABP1Q6G3_9HEXA